MTPLGAARSSNTCALRSTCMVRCGAARMALMALAAACGSATVGGAESQASAAAARAAAGLTGEGGAAAGAPPTLRFSRNFLSSAGISDPIMVRSADADLAPAGAFDATAMSRLEWNTSCARPISTRSPSDSFCRPISRAPLNMVKASGSKFSMKTLPAASTVIRAWRSPTPAASRMRVQAGERPITTSLTVS